MTMVQDSGFCSSADLSRTLEVSEMTVRRDIRKLSEQGLVRTVHGGVSLAVNELTGADFRARSLVQAEAKRAVGRRASELITEGSIIAIDAGTTAVEVARALPSNMRISVVTHSLPVLNILSSLSNIELIGLGGVYHHETQAFSGPGTAAALRHLRVQMFFLAAGGIRNGVIYSSNHYDAATKRALMEIADEVVLVTDSSKFRTTAMVEVAPISRVHTVICDDAIDPGKTEPLHGEKIRTIYVPIDPEQQA